ncbi:MAG TPA: ABC transporter substrate-binding protein, partial [Candidatus Tectomicrobia bacterium]|nr:ABC transporter substrate-binding protein [Candidatus Tectomicrobia bacterium]
GIRRAADRRTTQPRRDSMAAPSRRRSVLRLGVLLALFAVLVAVSATAVQAKRQAGYVIGVSNTLVGNGWRENMICSIKAQALASGKISKVIVSNRNTDTAGQVSDVRNLISAGANAIIVNPSSTTAFKSVVAQAKARGVKVIFVDQYVPDPNAWNATNDQEAYGYLGAKWLFKTLGGKGNVVEMRGIAGVPADTDRHKGFQRALEEYPGIKVVKSVFTNWTPATGGKQALDLLNSSIKIDGIWTSGIDVSVVNAFKTAHKPLVPIVGADNNGFLAAQLKNKGWRAAAVTNPATIGAVGVAMAVKLLDGGSVPKWVKLTPQVWDNGTAAGRKEILANYSAKRSPYDSARVQIKPWTTYTKQQYFACKGPGE